MMQALFLIILLFSLITPYRSKFLQMQTNCCYIPNIQLTNMMSQETLCTVFVIEVGTAFSNEFVWLRCEQTSYSSAVCIGADKSARTEILMILTLTHTISQALQH